MYECLHVRIYMRVFGCFVFSLEEIETNAIRSRYHVCIELMLKWTCMQYTYVNPCLVCSLVAFLIFVTLINYCKGVPACALTIKYCTCQAPLTATHRDGDFQFGVSTDPLIEVAAHHQHCWATPLCSQYWNSHMYIFFIHFNILAVTVGQVRSLRTCAVTDVSWREKQIFKLTLIVLFFI